LTNRSLPHPEQITRTIFEVFEDECCALAPYRTAFDGYRTQMATVSTTCLIRFDHNRYTVAAQAFDLPVEVSDIRMNTSMI
jgi:hypothetical protein